MRYPSLAFVALVSSSLAAASAAQSVKLNLPLPPSPGSAGGEVRAFELSPDESRVVYLAREDGDVRAELRGLVLDGASSAVVLTGALDPREDVHHELRFTGDGAEVLFAARLTDDEADEWTSRCTLYRVPAAGGAAPVALADMGDVIEPEFRLVGEWVVYTARGAEHPDDLRAVRVDGRDGSLELSPASSFAGATAERVLYLREHEGGRALHSVRPDGTGDVRLDFPAAARCVVQSDVRTSPDGKSVVFRADPFVAWQFEVFRVPIDGGAAPVRISGSLAANRSVTDNLAVTPDSQRALFRADRDALGRYELYSAPLDGSAAPVRVSGPLVAQGDVANSVRVTADGARVLYAADALQDERAQLFGAPIDGSGPAVLVSPFASATSDVLYGAYELAADGRVLYLADGAADEVVDLWSAPLDGSAPPAKLSASAGAGDVQGFQPSADGTRVLFRADAEVDERFDLFSVPFDGASAAVRLTDAGHPRDSRFVADGSRVLYRADAELPDQAELLTRPADASAPAVRLSGALAAGDPQGDVHTFALDTRGERAVYLADQTFDERRELVAVDVSGRPAHASLTGPTTGSGALGAFRVAGERCVYALRTSASAGTLFSAPLDGGAPSVELGPTRLPSGVVLSFSPDGSRVVWTDGVGDAKRLLVAPLDGSAAALLVSGPGAGSASDAFAIAPDSSRVAFVAELDGRDRVFSAPLDASAAPVAIGGAFVSGGEVVLSHTRDAPLVTPDSRHALYRADARVDGRIDLYRATLDGSEPPLALAEPALAAGDVQQSFRLTADGSRVVFRADLLADERFELFSVPLDGSSPPARVSGALVANGDVASFELSPDGARVFYVADQAKDERFELWVAEAAGGGRSSLVSAPLVEGGDVQRVVAAPNGAFVAYLADQETDGASELWLARPGAAPRRLNAPLVEGGLVAFDYAITSDSRAVVYLAEQDVDGQLELYHAFVDPRLGVARLNGPMTPGGDVYVFAPAPDGRSAFYLADEDERGVQELYLGRRGPPVRAAAR